MNKENKNKFTKELIDRLLTINTNNIGLFSGMSGVLLYLKSIKSYKYNYEVSIISKKIIENLSLVKKYALFDGLAGINFALLYSSDKYLNDYNTLINYQTELLKQSNIYHNNFDYLHGKLGIINSLIYHRLNTKNLFNEIINNILNINFIDSPQNYFADNKYINLGLAHGVSAYLNILVNVNRYIPGINIEKHITQNINYLLKYRDDIKMPNYLYPARVNSNGLIEYASRYSWCTGSLGISMTLLKASEYLKLSNISKCIISDLIRASRQINLNNCPVCGYSLCHGISGLVFTYKLLYYYYKIHDFKLASEYWENILLEIYMGNGINSFIEKTNNENYGLINGITGLLVAFTFESIDFSIFSYLLLMDIK